MAKIIRKLQKLFATNASAPQITQFGSFAAGSPVFSQDPDVIQALAKFTDGWFTAVVATAAPGIEDMNALFFLFARQLAYIFQAGVSEWEVGTTYYKGSIVSSNGDLYASITDNNTGNALTDTVNWIAYPGNSTLPFVEAMTQVARITGNTPTTILQDFVEESFVLPDTDRVVLTNVDLQVDAKNMVLSGSNLTGNLETEIYLNNAKAGKPIEFSCRYTTSTIFDVAVGTSTTVTHLTSSTDRSTEVKNASTTYGWLIRYERSSTSFPFTQADKGQRISITAATYGSDIQITHSAIAATLPAPTSLVKYVFVAENAQPIQRKIAAGSYGDITPSRIRNLASLNGVQFPTFLHSYWKMNAASGGEKNYAPSGPTYDLTAMGAPTSVAGKVAGIGARAGFVTGTDYFYVNLASSNATPYDSQVFAFGGWMKTGTTGIFDPLGGKYSAGPAGWQLRTSNTGFATATLDGTDFIASSGTLNDDVWHLVYVANIATSGAANLRLYVDNVMVGSFTGQTYTPAAIDMGMGVTLNGAATTFTGAMTLWEYWNSMPASWAEFEALINLRWNGGAGIDYGGSSYTLYGALANQTAALGDRLGIKAGLRREITSVNPAAVEGLSVTF